MTPQLQIGDQQLQLVRHPYGPQDARLQAWDRGDLLLIEALSNPIDAASRWNPAPPSQSEWSHYQRVMLLNDEFGALACALGANIIASKTDSFLSVQASQFNLSQHQLAPKLMTRYDTLPDPLPQVVLIKLPKDHDYLLYELMLLKQQLQQSKQPECPPPLILIAGRQDRISTKLLKRLEHHWGPATLSLAEKKWRIIHLQNITSIAPFDTYPKPLTSRDLPFPLVTLPNVFAGTKFDPGARFLLSQLPNIGFESALDLGCGNGILGAYLLRSQPAGEVTFVDQSFNAVACAELNCQQLGIDASRAHFLVTDCLQGAPEQLDLILCNPPFHQSHVITTDIAHRMFVQSHRHLRVGGKMVVVANRHLGYLPKVKKHFRTAQTIAKNHQFTIIMAQK